MTQFFGQLIAPNFPAKTSFTDIAAYFFGGFLLLLPVLPIPQIRLYFAIFTFGLYSFIILTLAIADLIRGISQAWQTIWQIQFLRIKMVGELA